MKKVILLALAVSAVLIGANTISHSPLQQLSLTVTEAKSEWPCQQRKVPRLTSSAFWSRGGVIEDLPWREDTAVSEAVPQLVSRRISLDEAQVLISRFAKANDADRVRKLTLLFAGVFAEMDALRLTVVRGISTYAGKQRLKSHEIAAVRLELETLKSRDAKTPGDGSRLSELQSRYRWLQRFYGHQETAARELCGLPSQLEYRLYVLGQYIEDEMPPNG